MTEDDRQQESQQQERDEATTEDAPQNMEEAAEAARRLAGELDVAQKQRAFLADQVSRLIDKHLGAQMSAGLIRAGDAVPLAQREIDQVNANLNRIAAQGQQAADA